MTPLEAAILRTVLYADVFNFAMTVAEIQHFLIHDQPTNWEQIKQALDDSTTLRHHLIRRGDYVARAGREALFDEREQREQASRRLWPLALRYGTWLARMPFVRMVAITGALAVRNAAAETDDLDYLLVAAPNRVWIARACAIVLVRLAKLRGVVICPNYVLAADALAQDREDLFIAHEIAQMIPLYGHALYAQFRAANTWADAQLPNAEQPFYPELDRPVGGLWALLKGTMERLMSGKVGDTLEQWEYRRKLTRFAPEMQTPHSAARLDPQRVKGHFHDYGRPVLDKYRQRLREYALYELPAAAPGD